ncbi:MAG: hypothetical protein SAJ37_11420, partial [Oscillatoria sp. PMC 1068.18]|nr:hypothetical protein [Oscillatoria sp. PMC 1068.18]
MFGKGQSRKSYLICSLAIATFSYGCQFRSFGDTPELRANCQQAIAQQYTIPAANVNLTFGRVDEGATAYQFSFKKEQTKQGICRVQFNGEIEQ